MLRTSYEGFVSTNSGQDWKRLSVRRRTETPTPTALFCLAPQNVWVSFSDGSVAVSKGSQINIMRDKSVKGGFSKIAFFDARSGVALQNGRLFWTNDSGATWRRARSVPDDLTDFALGQNKIVHVLSPGQMTTVGF